MVSISKLISSYENFSEWAGPFNSWFWLLNDTAHKFRNGVTENGVEVSKFLFRTLLNSCLGKVQRRNCSDVR